VTTDLIARARAGDDVAFAQLVDPHRRELQVHCYRLLGSVQDAEDALQEALLSAWQGVDAFEERASVRTWLYRIATNRCLNALRSARRRPQMDRPQLNVAPPEPTRLGEVMWLQPYPDVLLDEVMDTDPGPEARIEAREAISLAFVTALQLLPPLQRVVLVLRDVLGFRASEVAHILDTTEESVTSALKRARAGLQRKLPPGDRHEPPPAPGSQVEQALVARLTLAYETSDLDGLVALLTEDVWLTMPPLPLEYQGKELAARFFQVVAFRPGRRFRVVPTRANGQPAVGFYEVDPVTGISHANGIIVFTLAGDRVCAMTHFDTSVLPQLGLPRTLPD
jgi:RNA polymerase sigma-70 factor (TIGR02960 family)